MFSQYRKHAVLNRADFRIHGLDVGVVNALRRTILTDIPYVAPSFDPYKRELNDVRFLENTSSLHNEMLSHRLSLVPIYFSAAEMDSFKPEDYTFKIEKHNTGTEPILITSGDIQVYDVEGNIMDDDVRARLFPKDPVTGEHVLITKLKPNLFNRELGEKINVEYRARKSTAAHNACWCPVSLCSYSFTVDEAKAARALEAKLAEIADPDKRTDARKIFETLEHKRHYKTNEYGDPSDYDFSIESECALDPPYLFAKGCEVLSDRLKEAEFEVNVINPETNFYSLTFHHEDHTLGNLLQSALYNTYVRGGANEKLLTYVGYNIPHPLEHDMLLKLRFSRQVDPKEFMHKALDEVRAHIDDIKSNWLEFVGGVGESSHGDSKPIKPEAPTRAPSPPKKKPTSRKTPLKEVSTEVPVPPVTTTTQEEDKPIAPKKVSVKASKPKKGDIVEIIQGPSEASQEAPQPKKRAAPKKKTVVAPSEDENAISTEETPTPPTKEKKAPVRKTKAAKEAQETDAAEETPTAPKKAPARKRATKKADDQEA